MKLSKLSAENYRSLRGESIEFNNLNLFIGANASGKSTILDALNFLHEGIRLREFKTPVYRRGGMIHLTWKGESASQIQLVVTLQDKDRRYEWLVRLVKADSYGYNVEEEVSMTRPEQATIRLLESRNGSGWWLSGEEYGTKLRLKQDKMACALAVASANVSFQARKVVEFVDRWGFFDPNPFLLRNDWKSVEPEDLILTAEIWARRCIRFVNLHRKSSRTSSRQRRRSSGFPVRLSLVSRSRKGTFIFYKMNRGFAIRFTRWACPAEHCECWR